MAILATIKGIFSLFLPKSRKSWAILIGAILIITLILRACSHREAMQKSLYLIGRDSSWYPLELLGREKSLQAFTNELMSMIGNELGLRFEWRETSSSKLLLELDTGKYDAIISASRPNVVNEEHYVFSELIFEMGPVLIVPQDSNITSLKQMSGLTIGIRTGASTIFNAVRQGGANVYDFILVTYGNMNKALEALVNNQIDGVLLDSLPAYTITQGFYVGKLKVVTPPLTDEGLRIIAFKNPNAETLIGDINKALDKLKENGSYHALIAKWNLIDPEKDYWHPSQHVSHSSEGMAHVKTE